MKEITWAPGAVTAASNIDLPSDASPIDGIINAEIFRGADPTAATPTAATKVAATATKVDKNTVTLDVDTTTLDLIVLRYYSVGEIARP